MVDCRLSENSKDLGYDQHVKFILNSKLLLDEDLESILIDYVDSDGKPPKICSFAEIVTSSIVAVASCVVWRLYNIGCEILILSPLAVYGLKKICGFLYKRRQDRNVRDLVNCLQFNLKLHREMCNYFKNREERSVKRVDFDPFASKIDELFEVIKPIQTSIFNDLKTNICNLNKKVSRLEKMYGYVEALDANLLIQSTDNGFTEHYPTLQHCYDVFVLLTSHFLAALGVVLCRQHSSCGDLKIDELIDTEIFSLKKTILHSTNIINNEFNCLKFYYLKKEEIGLLKNHSEKGGKSKLSVQTLNVLAHTSEIVEKAKFISNFVIIQEAETDVIKDKKLLGDYIQDLGNDVLNFYEEIQMLQKKYEISIHRSSAAKPEVDSVLLPDVNPKSDTEDRQVSDVDISDIDLNDEVYEADLNNELYDDDQDDIFKSQTESDEQEKLSALVAMELNQKVKQHSRFLDARKRRGEPEVETNKPNDDLATAEDIRQCPVEIPEKPQDLKPVIPPPPPPLPPPRPSLQVMPQPKHLESADGNQSTIESDLSDKLKIAIQRRGPISEEVFDYSD